jgi:hypothetical protein
LAGASSIGAHQLGDVKVSVATGAAIARITPANRAAKIEDTTALPGIEIPIDLDLRNLSAVESKRFSPACHQ